MWSSINLFSFPCLFLHIGSTLGYAFIAMNFRMWIICYVFYLESFPFKSLSALLNSFLNYNQFTMEMAGAGSDVGNTPNSYSLNMFKDFVPMCIFSETNQGNLY